MGHNFIQKLVYNFFSNNQTSFPLIYFSCLKRFCFNKINQNTFLHHYMKKIMSIYFIDLDLQSLCLSDRSRSTFHFEVFWSLYCVDSNFVFNKIKKNSEAMTYWDIGSWQKNLQSQLKTSTLTETKSRLWLKGNRNNKY